MLLRQEGGGYFILLLQQFAKFNKLQRKENGLNHQWQYVHNCVTVHVLQLTSIQTECIAILEEA